MCPPWFASGQCPPRFRRLAHGYQDSPPEAARAIRAGSTATGSTLSGEPCPWDRESSLKRSSYAPELRTVLVDEGDSRTPGVGHRVSASTHGCRVLLHAVRWLASSDVSASVVARGIAAGFGARMLFKGLDLVVDPDAVIGLVGANGAGKSTLLRILAGLADPEEGAVTRVPSTAAIGYLAQENEARPGETVAEFLARRTGISAATEQLEWASAALVETAPGADNVYAAA